VNSIKSSVLAAVAALLAFPALGDSPSTKQWVLATAKATGAGGEQFVSSLRIVNPGTAAANVTLTYLAQSPIDGSNAATGDNTGAASVTVQVPAGQMLPIEDVIGTKFAGAAPFGIVAGGIKVISDQPVSVLSRTYVGNAVSSTGKPGTYGFSIPAQVDAQAIAVGDVGFVPYIAASPDRTSGFRCNFIMLNTVGASTVLTVALKKADGTVIGTRDYTLGKFSAAQQGDIAASFGYAGPDQNLFVVVTVKSGGPVVIGTSIIDNAISSLNYAPPTKTTSGGGVQDGVYGLVFQNDGYGLAARVDIQGGAPNYMFATLVLDNCNYYLILQALSSAVSSTPNTTFTRNTDGSYAFTGSSSAAGATWSGVIQFSADGGVTGTLTYGRTASASTCPNTSGTFPFMGHYSAPLTY
jgi:hypothetical protein